MPGAREAADEVIPEIVRVRRRAPAVPAVHAEIEGWRTVGFLRSAILHDTFRDWGSYLLKLDRYTTWGAEQDFKDGNKLLREKGWL